MEGNIYINGLIGSLPNEIGVELIDVIQQVKKQTDLTSLNVHINSEGGVVNVGFDIYHYLKSLNIPITTVGSGMVASIATVIFMAGDRRILKDNTRFMIHLPMGGVEGTSDEIASYALDVKNTEKRIVDFYKKELDITEEAIRPLLNNETWLNDSQLDSLNFTTEIRMPVMARAYMNNNNLKNEDMTENDKGFFMGLFDAFSKKNQKVVNLNLTDANGVAVVFPDLNEGDKPKVGDKATIEDKPAEGEVMIDGVDYVFVGGLISEIKEKTADDSEEMKALKAENESLKEQLTTAVANKETILQDVVNLKKQITSRFEFEDKKEIKTEELEAPTKRKLFKD